MVAPVTGPFNVSRVSAWPVGFTSVGFRKSLVQRTWYRQRPPFNQPLAFTSQKEQADWVFGSDRAPLARNVDSTMCWISSPTLSSSNAYNSAWSDFNEQLRGQASWAVTLIQYRQAYDSLVKHTTDLYHVFRDIKRLDFKALYKRFKPPKGFKMKGKTFSDHVLEWRFGWQPLWNDIHDSAEYLARDFGSFKAVGRGNGTWNESATYTLSGTYAEVREDRRAKYRQRVRIAADVEITNPQLVLWDSLGLTNPALVAYELIPWSFVLNYFISLEEFARGLSPAMGLRLVNPYYSVLTTVDTTLVGTPVRWSYPYPNIGPYRVSLHGATMTRTLGAIPAAKLRVRDPWILQPGRALNSVSLLLQQLAKR